VHHSAWLFLLSCIDGDATRAQTISAGVSDGSRAGWLKLQKPLSYEHPNSVLRLHTVTPKPI